VAVVTTSRDLGWDGAFNARDLGGLPAAGGRRIRPGALARSEAPDRLTAAGWAALKEHGIRTVVDLREPDERRALDAAGDLDVVHVPLDDLGDTAFWADWGDGANATPLYYPDFLARKPERCAAALGAVARARPGGVLVHCAGGRDRTGLVTMLLLGLAGVPDDEIVADYLRSFTRMTPLWAALGEPDHGPLIHELLAGRGTTPEAAMRAALDGLDAEATLRAGGLTGADLESLRNRLLE
jgi:protein tyrosine/serine phosphatase